MVGIAGKSRGCTTCRRRKIRCDFGQPSCQNCIKGGKTCEGYERYPVFINRTTAGLQKQTHLAEARSAFPASSAELETGQSSGATQALAPRMGSPPLPQVPALQEINHSRVISWFWNAYRPLLTPTASSGRGTDWLYHVINIASPTPALQQGLLALSVTRYGRMSQQEAVIREGQRIYSRALRLLQRALYEPDLMLHDETLGAVRIFILNELFETTDSGITGWSSHVSGMTRLLQVRGPRRHNSPLARAIMQDTRYNVLMQAIIHRKSSPFGRQEWLVEPWADCEKDTLQQVFDQGFVLADLLEQCDNLIALADGPEKFGALVHLLQGCNSLQQAFNSLTKKQPGQFDVDGGPRKPCSFSDYEQMETCLVVMALQLNLTLIARPLVTRFRTLLASRPMLGSPALQALCEQTGAWSTRQRGSDIAQSIMSIVPIYLESQMGLFGASRCIYPLKAAYLHYQDSETERNRCSLLLRELSQARGFRVSSSVHTSLAPALTHEA